MALPRYEVHPSDITDLPCNWQLPSGVTVSSVAPTVSPAGPTVTGSAPSSTQSQTRFSGGTTDILYQVDEVVTFSNGEKRTSEFEVFVKNN